MFLATSDYVLVFSVANVADHSTPLICDLILLVLTWTMNYLSLPFFSLYMKI